MRAMFSSRRIEKAMMQFQIVLGMISKIKTTKHMSESQQGFNYLKVDSITDIFQ